MRPGTLDNVDLDAYAAFTGEALGVPHQLRRSQDQITEIRAARAEQVEFEQDAQLAAGAADAGAKLLKAAPEIAEAQ